MSAAERTAAPAARPEQTAPGPVGQTSVYRLADLRFLRSELRLIFGRRRNQAGLLVLAAVPVIMAIAVKVSQPRPGRGPDFLTDITSNGLFVALAALGVELGLFLPLAVAAIASDAVAGEANIGTLRYLLTVPVGRTRMLVLKFAAVSVFALVATLVVAVTGMAVGVLLFGGGPMGTLSGTSLPFMAGVGRVLLATVYLALCLTSLGAIGLFVSTLTEQPIGATIAVVMIDVLSFILDSIPQLDWLHEWLPTHWWLAFGDVFRDPVAWDGMSRGLLLAAAYVAVFWLAAWARFGSKDITS